ncbi:MAG: hypothetical protein RMJ98_01920 [Myxococcales bacterium]|nr:hypothetical protein [Polyangiaceae bacterium]MDW8248045.1 hypothetical protein [Myxococcales bacterium]
MALFAPWIVVRLAAGVVATTIFVYGAWVGWKVLRYFHLKDTSEGQLALERQFELASASIRVGAAVQGLSLLLSLTATTQLAPHLRGAMCGHGVVHAVPSGPPAVVAAGFASLASLVLWRLLSLDRQMRSLVLLRPLSAMILLVALLSLVDLALTASWLGSLDFSVVASCCSSGLDAREAVPISYGTSGELLAYFAPLAAMLAAGVAWVASRTRERVWALAAGGAGLGGLPLGLVAIPQVVAPYAYEVPHHRCGYCLFRSDVLWLGYPLLGAMLLALSSVGGAALGAWLTPQEDRTWASWAPAVLRTGALAWVLVLVLGLAPVLRFLWLSGGIPLG